MGHEWRVDTYPLCTPLDEFQPGFDVRVVDADGNDVEDGEEGEIIVRGPTVTSRIYKVARHKTFDPDGYYFTGDRGVPEGDRIHFIGRNSDVIKVSGANVSLPEVEEALLAHPDLDGAHAAGIEDGNGGQSVGAAVVPSERADASVDDLIDHVAQRLSSYKVPTSIVFVTEDDVPVTPSKKVSRPALATLITARS